MRNYLSQIDITKLTDKNYLFDLNPETAGFYQLLLIVFILMIVLAVFLKYFPKSPNKIQKKLNNKLFNLLLVTGILGILWVFCRKTGVAYLNTRFALIIIIIFFLLWVFDILYYKIIISPKELIKLKKQERFEKYLPHAKSRGLKGK
jgi:hypothetical protein